jgi:tetratricopeptide (TPR) repeat protein
MEQMMGGAAGGKRHEHEAQDLVYEAWKCADPEDVVVLLQEALDLDPTNIDARLGLMDFMPMEDEERMDLLRDLVAMAQKNLGKKTFKRDKGHFWGLLETRPYMRARSQLALRLMEAGRIDESIAEHEGMLGLNPNDNQGVRYALMACYLIEKRLEEARRLFDQYDERTLSATFAWAYVLERYLSGDLDGARRALANAQKQNSHAMAYFLQHRKLPKAMPDSYGIGSREEAMIAWDILQPAWKKYPEAGKWLKAEKR